jgi:hypothetical protein
MFTPRVIRLAVAAAMIMGAISGFRSHRVRAAAEAALFQPATAKLVPLPAGTAIRAVIRNGIASSAVPGDTVLAFVSMDVVFNDRVMIPSVAQLKGSVEDLDVFGATGQARLNFTGLLTPAGAFLIHTRPVQVITPLQSDTKILFTALTTPLGAILGAAMGAESGDVRMIIRGLMAGTSAIRLDKSEVPITVTLTRDLKIRNAGT